MTPELLRSNHCRGRATHNADDHGRAPRSMRRSTSTRRSRPSPWQLMGSAANSGHGTREESTAHEAADGRHPRDATRTGDVERSECRRGAVRPRRAVAGVGDPARHRTAVHVRGLLGGRAAHERVRRPVGAGVVGRPDGVPVLRVRRAVARPLRRRWWSAAGTLAHRLFGLSMVASRRHGHGSVDSGAHLSPLLAPPHPGRPVEQGGQCDDDHPDGSQRGRRPRLRRVR